MEEQRQESKLIRNLGFMDLMAIAVGQIVGAGIMSSTGVAIGMTGTGVVLCVLSYTLFASLSMKVVIALVYGLVVCKKVTIENDLIKDYTSK